MNAIPIKISTSFWLLSGLIGFLYSQDPLIIFFLVCIVFISVFIHEMGHAITATFFGQKASIEFGFLGGLTVRQGPHLTIAKEFLVTLMGPLCSIFLALIGYLVAGIVPKDNEAAHTFFSLMAIANTFWSLLNLLPVLPLDGGRLMQLALESFFGRSGERFAYLVSFIASIFLTIGFFYIGAQLIGCLFLLFVFESYKAWQYKKYSLGDEVENQIVNEIQKAADEWKNKQFEEAMCRLEKVISERGQSLGVVDAVINLSSYLLDRGDPKRAVTLLTKYQARLSIEGLKLLQLALYEIADWNKALEIGKKVFLEDGGDVSSALINSFASARLKQVQQSLNWLLRAQEEGDVDIRKIIVSEDFDTIRKDPLFHSLLEQK